MDTEVEEVKIQVRFTIEKDGLSYSDALYFTPEEYESLDKKEIKQMQKERFQNYKQMLKDAQDKPPKTDEEQLAELEKAELEQTNQLTETVRQRIELEGKVRPPEKGG